MYGQGRPPADYPASDFDVSPRVWLCPCVLLVGVLCGTGFAQDGFQAGVDRGDHQRFMLEDAQLNAVAFVNVEQGWAVGDRGVIWHTGDGGRTWQLQKSGVDCRLESVCFIDQRTGWAVGGTTQPWSHRGTGVVLRTLDGGRRWTELTGSMLPALKDVKFFSPTRGWAVGSPSALFESGVFQTDDGGRSWSPVDAPAAHWLCADFRDENSGAIAGRDGELSIVMTKGAIKSRTPGLGLRSIRDMRLPADTPGWLVGDGGLVMTSSDAGLSWQLPPRPIPPAALHEIDFTAVASVGDSVWAVGSPGTLVLHSPDGGRSWQLQRTGQPLPLHAIDFVDAQRGWAVGAMGTVLATADGGKTWHRQHSGGTRSAMLVVVADDHDLPLEMLARLGGEEGYLCVVSAIGRHAETDTAKVASEDRLRDAVVAAGGSTARESWNFPLRENTLALSKKRVVEHWNRVHDGRAMPTLEADLTRLIRTWRPEIIITHSERATSSANQLTGELVRAAAKSAADTTLHTEQITHADLQPWAVKKLLSICEVNEAGDVSVSAASLALRLGRSAADYTAHARGVLREDTSPAPTLVEFRVLSHDVAAAEARRDFFSGLVLHPGGEARRRIGDIPPGNVDALRKLAQRRRNVEQLIAQTETVTIDDDAWLGQVNEMTRGLNDQAASRLIFQLGTRYAQSGRGDLAEEAFQILAERYRDQPISEQAMRWLILHYTSSEAAWRRRDLANPTAQPARFDIPQEDPEAGGVQQVVFDDELGAQRAPASGTRRPGQHPPRQLGRAIAIYDVLRRTNPTLAAEPSLKLAIGAAQRLDDDPRVAEATYRQIAGQATRKVSSCAKAELWLRDPRGECPKPLGTCVPAKEKPFLDGKLDDAIWKNCKPIPLSSDQALAASPATVRFARDDDYLYVAVECRNAPIEYQTDNGPRERDADLSQTDRIELLLDVNRDWNTAYRFRVDYRGWAADAIDGDGSWDPRFHVAAHHEGEHWRMEAAIPLEELGPAPPGTREVWAVGIERIVPAVGKQSWPVSETLITPADSGLLLFQ